MDKTTVRNNLVKVLEDMKAKAEEMNMQGVAVAAFLDAEDTIDWIGEMKVVGQPYSKTDDHGWNLVAIAWSKAGEVIATSANSGNPDIPRMTGELGYVGGAYGEHKGCKLAFAFSGGTSEDDLVVAQYGIQKFIELMD